MLDVHPPHAPTHTWRDFFIHIATITIGLLIAVGLEQTVEYIHHHHQAEHARQLIVEEVKANRAILERNIELIDQHDRWLQADLVVLDHLRHNSLQPADTFLFVRTSSQFGTSAWVSSHQSNAVDYLPYSEVVQWESLYAEQQVIDNFSIDAKNNLTQATSVLHTAYGGKSRSLSEMRRLMRDPNSVMEDAGADDLRRLTPVQIDRLEQGIQIGISQDEQMLRWCIALEIEFQAN